MRDIYVSFDEECFYGSLQHEKRNSYALVRGGRRIDCGKCTKILLKRGNNIKINNISTGR